MDKISIIIPVFNTEEKLLENCLQSALNQNYANIEIIMVDDGSDRPDTVRKCKELASSDKKITYIRQVNQGPSAARGAGIAAADGKYMLFLDSDDALPVDACSYLYNLIQQNKGDIAEGAAKEVEDNSIWEAVLGPTSVKNYTGTAILLDKMVDGSNSPLSWSLWAKLFRTDIMRKYYRPYPSLMRGEDVLALADYLVHCKNLVYSGKCIYYYNKGNTQSLTRNKNEALDSSLYFVWKKMMEIYRGNSEKTAYERVKANYCTTLFGLLVQYVCAGTDGLKPDIIRMKKEMRSHSKEFLFNKYISRRFRCIVALVYPEVFRYRKNIRSK